MRYPDSLIAEMRRLSLGVKVTASIVRFSGDTAEIRVVESNGVMVTITSADVHIVRRNRFAKKISYFVMHVPEGSSARYSVGVGPVSVCGSSRTVRLNLPGGKGISDYMLGAEVRRTVVLSGVDEVGRVVTAKVEF